MIRRFYRWYIHARSLGFVIFAASMLYGGHGISQAVAHLGGHSGVDAETVTRTLPGATTTLTRPVTVRLPGKVIRRVDHTLIVRTPRYVFVYHGRRRVIQPKTVRIRFEVPIRAAPPVVAAVLNQGTPATVTVTVPVTVTVTGPTTTVTGPTTTVTLPQETTTVTVPTTITVPLTLTSG
jgi:hypothetical protein